MGEDTRGIITDHIIIQSKRFQAWYFIENVIREESQMVVLEVHPLQIDQFIEEVWRER